MESSTNSKLVCILTRDIIIVVNGRLLNTPLNRISYSTSWCIQCTQHQTGFLTAQDSAYSTKQDSLLHKTVHTTPNRLLPRLNGSITNIERERTLIPDGDEHYRCKLVPARLGVSTVNPFSVSAFLFRVDVPFKVFRHFLFQWHNGRLHY
jgi:hypothetical protein